MASYQVPMMYALRSGGDLEAAEPLSLHEPARSHDEAIDVARCELLGAPDQLELRASIPTSEAMGEAAPKGEYVIFQELRDGREAKDGDVVLAIVKTRRAPRFRWLDRVLHRHDRLWWANLDMQKDCERAGVVDHFVIRRYGHDSQGRQTLSADVAGFTSWTEGEGLDGRDVDFYVLGTATPYKAVLHSPSEVLAMR